MPIILSLIHELAAYEKAASSVLATETSLLETLSFPSNPASGYAKTLLLFAPHPPSTASKLPSPQCAGMALYFNNYSTWRAAPGIYLEDLFVRPEYRGRGYGKRLLQELAKETKRIGGKRFEWSVLKWNEPSIKFYKAIGAQQMDEWVTMRVDDEALDKMAESEGGSQLEKTKSWAWNWWMWLENGQLPMTARGAVIWPHPKIKAYLVRGCLIGAKMWRVRMEVGCESLVMFLYSQLSFNSQSLQTSPRACESKHSFQVIGREDVWILARWIPTPVTTPTIIHQEVSPGI